MDVEVENYGNMIVCRLLGRWDAVATVDFEEKIDLLINKGFHKIIVNMKNVTYLSSSGIRLLLSMNHRFNSLKGCLCICHPIDQVAEVLEVSGFGEVLKICGSEQECFSRI